jgi:hypothetical protein
MVLWALAYVEYRSLASVSFGSAAVGVVGVVVVVVVVVMFSCRNGTLTGVKRTHGGYPRLL